MLTNAQKQSFLKQYSIVLLLLSFFTIFGNAVEINTSIQNGDDDIEESASGSMSMGSSDLELVVDGSDQTIGLRFIGLDIPQGATITNAYIQFTVDEIGWDDSTILNIQAQNSANAPVFGTTSGDASSRAKTSASVSWEVPLWEEKYASTELQRTPNLNLVMQEIVDMTEWEANNAMVFILNGTGKRVADSYEGGADRAPKLHISYEIDGSEDDNTTNDDTSSEQNITIIEVSINSNDNDVEELDDGHVYMHSSDLELVHDGVDQVIGLRFTEVNIPAGVEVTSAYIQFTADETHSDATNLNIYAEGINNSPILTSDNNNISNRTKTTASSSWSVPAWGTVNERGDNQQTPELKNLVQEVLNLDGWQSNNAMTFIIDGTGKRVADSHEGGADKAPTLHIEYKSLSSDDNTTDSGEDDSNSTYIAKTLDTSISSGNNDVEELEDGHIYLDSSDLEMVHEGEDQTIGLRFTGLNIPQGSTITNAYIQFTVDETDATEATLLNIYAENSDDAPIFSSSTSDVTSRAKTSASASWDVPVWDVSNESGEKQRTPELATLIQEVVNRNGWQEGSAMAFIIQGSGKRVADSYEGGAEKAPKLHIEYEVLYEPNKTTFVEDSSANILNPDRGLYTADYSLTKATDYNIFSSPYDDGYRIVYSPINLYDYIETETLPSSLIDTVNGHLDDAQEKGIKIILRFKYRPDASDEFHDPALSIIMGHMDQLKDTLQSHKEIISVIQAGTIGAWGEWNRFTDEFADTDSNYKANRRAIIAKLSEIFPDKFIQIRTPMHKELLYGTSAEYEDEGTEGMITPELAFGDDIRAKVGHHNDCLMINDSNYGTYGDNIEFWKDYVANDSKYSPTGGETCGIVESALTDCSNAVPELKRLQYSYLNNVYHEDVLQKWRDQGCYQEIKENLGYRLVATSLNVVKSDDNSTLNVELAIDNKGFASPYIKSNVNLVLRNEQNSYSFNQANIDMRTFYADKTNSITSNLPLENVATGSYCLYLQIGESFSSIRLSNSQNSDGVDIWDEDLRMNRLKCGVEL